MATFPGTYHDREYQNFKSGPAGESLRQVTDEQAQGILTQILSALGGATTVTPTVLNLAMPLAGTEYSLSLGTNILKATIKPRSGANIRLGFAVGSTSTTWITIPAGAGYEMDAGLIASLTIYVQSDVAATTLEVITWA